MKYIPHFIYSLQKFLTMLIGIGTELAGAAGARAPPLFDPHPEIL